MDVKADTGVVEGVVSTATLKRLVDAGLDVSFEPVDRRAGVYAGDTGHAGYERRVTAVEYDDDEPVQCIRVDDEDHMYVTDGLIPTHNTADIIFLKSTDDSMLETLSKMSGVHHVSRRNSKTVTHDTEKLAGGKTDAKVSYTMSTEEEPVISTNDLFFIPPRNMILFRAGDPPVWNRNETIMPMSWRLFQNTIVQPGHKYSLQTIPTLSSAMEFDVRTNQPDFMKMLSKRFVQVLHADDAMKMYKDAFGYSDYDVSRLDPDVYAAEVMDLIDELVRGETGISDVDKAYEVASEGILDGAVVDEKAANQVQAAQEQARDRAVKRYAGGRLSRDDILEPDGTGKNGVFVQELSAAYSVCIEDFRADARFVVRDDGSLYSADGRAYMMPASTAAADRRDADMLEGASRDPDQPRVAAEPGALDQQADGGFRWKATSAFLGWLGSLKDWHDVAGGAWDDAVSRAMESVENDD